MTVQDLAGNVSNPCTAEVTVIPASPIFFNLVDISTVSLDENGEATLVAEELLTLLPYICNDVLSIRFNDGQPTRTYTCADIGEQFFEVGAYTPNGSSVAGGERRITVVDDLPPTVTCQDITLELNESGRVLYNPSMLVASQSDNCGLNTGISPESIWLDCSNLGTNERGYSAFDNSWNQGSCTSNVTVIDPIAPTALCEDISIQLDETGNTSIIPENVDAGSVDNCGIAETSLSQNTFSCLDIGEQSVTLTVTDQDNKSSSCVATINVVDETGPALAAGLLFVDCLDEEEGDLYQVDLTATDNCGAEPTILSVIELPEMDDPRIIFRKKNKKKLKFQFNQNKITVDAPGNGGAQTWWNEIQAQGGIEVVSDQQLKLNTPENNNTALYKFNNNGDLNSVTGIALHLTTRASDDQGNENATTYTAQLQCTDDEDEGDDDDDYNNSDLTTDGGRLTADGRRQTEELMEGNAATPLNAFPNPFSSILSIEYTVTKNERVTLSIYNLQGQLVKQLENERLGEGVHRSQWDGSDVSGMELPSGMYLIQLQIGDERSHKKVLLQRD